MVGHKTVRHCKNLVFQIKTNIK